MFHGHFNDFLMNLSHKPVYRELLSSFGKFKFVEYKPDKNRMMDVEMILRFFALYEEQKISKNGEYPPPRKEFLNSYMYKKTSRQIEESSFNVEIRELEVLFEKVISMVKNVFRGNHFKRFAMEKEKSTFFTPFNKSVFDIQTLGFIDYEQSDISNNEEIIYDAFLDVSCYDQKLINAVKITTNEQVDVRVKIWKNKLHHVLENSKQYREKLEHKRKLFYNNPICTICHCPIETIEESDTTQESCLVHRACIVEKTIDKTRSNTIQFILIGEEHPYDFEPISDALDFLVELLKERIDGDFIEIERLSSLHFVGTHKSLNSKGSSSEKGKKLRSLKIETDNGETLFMDYSGNRNEVVSKIREITSLYDFVDISE
ncbi:MAG: hypothetical protein RIT27_116 [Pseudomonadota bacterium]|jgi:hypothetical protein